MPGIVGFITRLPRKLAEPLLLRMVETLRHESFYVTGTWMDESLGVYVGWVARKDSFCDRMPLSSETGDRVLVFSGEEFPEPGIAARLKTSGHEFDSDGPSYLVHLSEEDPAFPAGLNGRFHGLLVDRAGKSVMLFNDRYGLQRIYYHESEDAFYFAAEAKAILAVRPELRRADIRGLGEFITCGCVLENRTLYENIHVLPPASVWIFRDSSLASKASYFHSREWEEQTPLDRESYYRELREVFARNLPRYFNGREPVGMSLTGGLDTRMILAWHKPPAGSLPCYTFGGTYRESRDVVVAREVARACEQPHQGITVGKEFLSRFADYAERAVYLTDGCVEVNRAPTLYSNEKAREIAPVRITGNYGGEVLRRVRMLKAHTSAAGLFRPEVYPSIDAARETVARTLDAHPLTFAVFRQVPWYNYGLSALEHAHLAVRTPYLDNDFVKTVFRAPQESLKSTEASLRLVADGDPTLLGIRGDLGQTGNHGPLHRAVARRFHEFTFKAEYAYDYGMPQWVAQIDHLLAPFRPERLFLGRHKYYHFRVWYRDLLAGYVREMLLDSRTLSRQYLNRKSVEAIVEGHTKGLRNYTTEIHKMLTLELIHRTLFDGQRTTT